MTHRRAYALLLLVTVLWAGNFPFGKLALNELGPFTLTAERPWASLAQASVVGWGVILYAAGPLTLGHVLYYRGVSVVGAGRAAIFMNLIPFLVIGLSWLFLGERVYWYHLVGATAAIAGVGLVTTK
jgi:drug/metabolite transporter (DMT)-like permease